MEVFVGHQNQKPNPPCPPEAVPLPMAFRIGRRIPGLDRLLIVFGFRACIRNIWIREGSLEYALGHARGGVKAKHKADNLYTVWSVSCGLENPPFANCNWRVQSDSDGASESSTQDNFINNCWTTNGPNGAVAYVNRLKCGPNDRYMQWAGIWRKQV